VRFLLTGIPSTSRALRLPWANKVPGWYVQDDAWLLRRVTTSRKHHQTRARRADVGDQRHGLRDWRDARGRSMMYGMTHPQNETARYRFGHPLKRWVVGLVVVTFALIAGCPLAFAQDEDSVEITYDYDYDADTDPSALDDFDEPLGPYGVWVMDPTYGRVWVPSSGVVGDDFTPYRSHGRWAVSTSGDWVWVSDFNWGYIPFHYGRWVFTSARGWVWIPGRVYAPAWVTWRTGAGVGYVGWAPAPPTYVWFGGVAVGFYGSVGVPWWYCNSRYFFSPGWRTYIVRNPARVRRIHARTRVYDRYHGRHHRRPATGRARRPAKGSASRPTQPRSGSAVRYGVPKSPSFKEAGIDRKYAPKKRVEPNRKAMSLRRPVISNRKVRSKRSSSLAGSRRTSPMKRSGTIKPRSSTIKPRRTMGSSSSRSRVQVQRRPSRSRVPSRSLRRPRTNLTPSRRSLPSRGYKPPRSHQPQRGYHPQRGYQPSRQYRAPSRSSSPRSPSQTARPRTRSSYPGYSGPKTYRRRGYTTRPSTRSSRSYRPRTPNTTRRNRSYRPRSSTRSSSRAPSRSSSKRSRSTRKSSSSSSRSRVRSSSSSRSRSRRR